MGLIPVNATLNGTLAMYVIPSCALQLLRLVTVQSQLFGGPGDSTGAVVARGLDHKVMLRTGVGNLARRHGIGGGTHPGAHGAGDVGAIGCFGDFVGSAGSGHCEWGFGSCFRRLEMVEGFRKLAFGDKNDWYLQGWA